MRPYSSGHCCKDFFYSSDSAYNFVSAAAGLGTERTENGYL